MYSLPGITMMSLLAMGVAGVTVPAAAQHYPVKPVRIVTGDSGTMMDIVSRQLAQRLGVLWGRSLVVENRGGVGNSTAHVSQATPNGYTLLVADSGALAIRPHLFRSLPYDPARDFAAIVQLASSPSFLVTHPSVPAANLTEFLAHAKQQPGGMHFATAGPWTANHLTVELFKRSSGLDITPVNYKGGGAVMTAIVSGETKAAFSTPFMALPHVKAGRIKAYAVTSDKRFAGAPDIPTMAEAGAEALVTSYWFGLLAPARTPPDLVSRINRDVVVVLQSPAMRSALLEQGAEPGGGTPEEFRAFIRSETARFGKAIEAAGIRPE